MEKKVEKEGQKISAPGKLRNSGFVYLKTLITIVILLLLAGSMILCLGKLFRMNEKSVSTVKELIDNRNIQVINEIY